VVFRSGKSTIISLVAPPYAVEGAVLVDDIDLATVDLNTFRRSWAWCCRTRFCRWIDSRKHHVFAAGGTEEQFCLPAHGAVDEFAEAFRMHTNDCGERG